MATKVKTTNQEFPIPDEWVALSEDTQEAKNQRDARLKRLLSTYIPSINNAQLTYSTQEEETIVRVTTQLGTKGVDMPFFPTAGMQCNLSGIHETLRSAPAYVPPVLLLAWELKWLQVTGKLTFEKLLEYQPKIEKALAEREPYQLVTYIHQRLKDLPPAPSPVAPLGF
jgi:hypothetical protein